MMINNNFSFDKLADQHKRIFEQYQNNMGERMCTEFLEFLIQQVVGVTVCRFHLQEDDPNYDSYAVGIESDGGPIYYYRECAFRLQREEKATMIIDFCHLSSFNFKDENFMEKLLSDFARYEPYLRKAIFQFLTGLGYPYVKNKLFQLAIHNLPQVNKIRELKTGCLGKLMSINGTVTRTTEVKPELLIGCFKCQLCKSTVQSVEQQFKFTQPVRCINTNCQNTNNWDLVSNESSFIDWQKIRVQEHSSDIPAGSMPRSVDVILRGDIVDQAKPGDRSIFTGMLVAVPDIYHQSKPGEKTQAQKSDMAKMQRTAGTMDGVSGLSEIGVRDLSYKMVFIACNVTNTDSRFGFKHQEKNVQDNDEEEPEMKLSNLSRNEQAIIVNMKDQSDLLTKMAESIAPNVFGHLDVKKGLLLQLFGGIVKRTQDNIKLRGDINICIVGDPATAKSQFLKYVCGFLPRAIYTSGKSSSAAGLTASIRKDHETGEYCIEAGALMLADYGICCIDEFDKMDVKDQVAIHEAMEQQTISIAKAGIQATLNARTSILAAANPIYGRYDRAKTLRQNVLISPPIMSRFDLFFVIFDDKNEQKDYHIARHIISMHRNKEDVLKQHFSKEQLQTYIKICRTLKPQLTKDSAKILKEEYKNMRQNSIGRNAFRYTVRQLESLVRLSEAMARLHCDETIKPSYVKEVCRLLRSSNINIVKEDLEIELNNQQEINLERQQQRYQENKNINNDLFEMEEELNNKSQSLSAPVDEPKQGKFKIKHDEYEQLTSLIVLMMKQYEKETGIDSVYQSEIVNTIVQQLEINENRAGTSVQRAELTSQKLVHVIQHLITKENVLIITQDSKIKSERLLCLNVNNKDEYQMS